MEEIWKDIKGFEGLYKISNLGRVKSLPKLHNSIHPYITKEKILSPRVCGSQREYLSVALMLNNKMIQKRVHRLVAEAFIPNPKGYKEVNHIDENKRNNIVDNLEWCDRTYNVNYGSRTRKFSKTMSIPIEQLDNDFNVINTYPSMEDAAKKIGVNSSNVSRACSIKSRKCKGYYWKYKKGYYGRGNN